MRFWRQTERKGTTTMSSCLVGVFLLSNYITMSIMTFWRQRKVKEAHSYHKMRGEKGGAGQLWLAAVLRKNITLKITSAVT